MALRQRKTRLAFFRKVRGISQEELARRIHVTGRTVRNWELDMTSPTRDQAEALAKALGVSVRELFPYVLF